MSDLTVIRAAVRAIDDVVFRVIERRRQQGDGNDLISLLLHMVDAETGEQMTAQQLRDEAVTMFLAGYETTATTLAWIWHAITQQPEIERKLQAEVDAALGDRTPVFADLPNLPYARMVMQESLRLYPPAYWLPRKALADDEIDERLVGAAAIDGQRGDARTDDDGESEEALPYDFAERLKASYSFPDALEPTVGANGVEREDRAGHFRP